MDLLNNTSAIIRNFRHADTCTSPCDKCTTLCGCVIRKELGGARKSRISQFSTVDHV